MAKKSGTGKSAWSNNAYAGKPAKWAKAPPKKAAKIKSRGH